MRRASPACRQSRHPLNSPFADPDEELVRSGQNNAAQLIAEGNTYFEKGELFRALQCFQEAERHLGAHPELLVRIGAVLLQLRRLDQAEGYFRRAAENPQVAPVALECLGIMLKTSGRTEEAIVAFESAALLNPKNGSLWGQLGDALIHVGRYEEAKPALTRSVAWAPCAQSYLTLAFAHQCLGAWQEAESAKTAAMERCKTLDEPLNPLTTLLLGFPFCDVQEVHSRHAERFARAEPVASRRNPQDRLRVGYLSPDFSEHPVGLLLHGLLPHHDRTKFHITAYALARAPATDQIRSKIEDSVEQCVDLVELSDEEAAQQIRDNGTDILIDLAGYSFGGRPGILALRPAPLQCSWLGYPGNTGAHFIDVYITHEKYVPVEHRPLIHEELALLPETPFACDGFSMPEKAPSRKEVGLPEVGVIFCCLHNPYRISERSFSAWMEILGQVPDSYLWLMHGGETHRNNLKAYARNHDVDPSRLYFHSRCRLSDTWPHRAADIWLDCLDISGGTSGFLCAWAALPMLTMWGESAAERTGAMVMEGLRLGHWVCDNRAGYVARAIEWASSSALREALQKELSQAKRSSPLFSPAHFVRDLEAELVKQIDLRTGKPARRRASRLGSSQPVTGVSSR